MNDELVLQEIMLPAINYHDDGKVLFLIGQKVMIVGAQRSTQECQWVTVLQLNNTDAIARSICLNMEQKREVG